MRLQKKGTTWTDVDLDPALIITVKQARDLTGLTYPGLVRALERGILTELIDPTRAGTRSRRRYLLRTEVIALAASRKRRLAKAAQKEEEQE